MRRNGVNNLLLALITILLGLIVYFVKDIHGEATAAAKAVNRIELQNTLDHTVILNELSAAEKDRTQIQKVILDHEGRIGNVEKYIK